MSFAISRRSFLYAIGLATLLAIGPTTLAKKPGGGGPPGGGNDDPLYHVVDLGGFVPQDGTSIGATGLGLAEPVDGVVEVVGKSHISGGADYPILWSVDGETVTQSTLPESAFESPEDSTDFKQGYAAVVNTDGLSAGQTEYSLTTDDTGCYWFGTSGPVLLPTFVGAPVGEQRTQVQGINEGGYIVGRAANGSQTIPKNSGAMWHVDVATGVLSGPVDLEAELFLTYGVNYRIHPLDINDSNVIVGSVGPNGSLGAAKFWSDNGTWVLEFLDHPDAGRAINNLGEVVADTDVYTDLDGAGGEDVWGWVPLPSLGGTIVEAVDINDAGQIVGHSEAISKPYSRAALWSIKDDGTVGAATDLSAVLDNNKWSLDGWTIGINNAGQITGEAYFSVTKRNRERRGCLLTPIAGN